MVAGMGTMMHMASSNTILQTLVDDDKRGRVMSFYILSFSGFAPLGNLIAGWAAHLFGVRQVVACGGILTFMAGVVFIFLLPTMRRYLRPVPIKEEIVPVDTAVEIK